jgi:glycosyltransferase involved in cell wall biosynthesis
MRHAMLSAHGIIANSTATDLDLARFARDRGLPTPPSAVAWLGIDGPTLPAPTVPPDSAYFVMVGTIEARKNHLLILNAWSDLVARLGEQAPKLVIIGQRGWEARAVFEILDNPGALANHVQELGSCDDSAMNRLIAGARAVLMPSFVEGFGLPLVEALNMGAPVIASDLAVFHEIAGDIPEYLDPADSAGWTDALIEYGANGRRRQAQLERMAQFEAPRWSSHFGRVEAFLASI